MKKIPSHRLSRRNVLLGILKRDGLKNKLQKCLFFFFKLLNSLTTDAQPILVGVANRGQHCNFLIFVRYFIHFQINLHVQRNNLLPTNKLTDSSQRTDFILFLPVTVDKLDTLAIHTIHTKKLLVALS
jgi:hypothetical protein